MSEISVIMSVYKEPLEWIKKSIDSILNQTFQDFEFIIVNDNPSESLLQSFLEEKKSNDNRINIIRNEENIGLTKSLNKALSIAKGTFIARMDADDISLPERFSVQVNFLMNHPEIDVCGTRARFFGNISIFSKHKIELPIFSESIKSMMLFDNPIIHPSVMMRRIINGYPFKYDEETKKAQDFKLWYDLSCVGIRFYNIPKYLLKYRVSKNQISAINKDSQNLTSDKIRSSILQELGYTPHEIEIHLAVCHNNKDNISFEDKKEWLFKLFYRFEKDKFLKKLIQNLLIKNSLSHKRKIEILNSKIVDKSVLFNSGTLRLIVKKIIQ